MYMRRRLVPENHGIIGISGTVSDDKIIDLTFITCATLRHTMDNSDRRLLELNEIALQRENSQ